MNVFPDPTYPIMIPTGLLEGSMRKSFKYLRDKFEITYLVLIMTPYICLTPRKFEIFK